MNDEKSFIPFLWKLLRGAFCPIQILLISGHNILIILDWWVGSLFFFFRLTYGWVHCCWNVVKIYIGWKVSFLFRVWMRGLSFRWVWCHISWTCWYLKILGSGWYKMICYLSYIKIISFSSKLIDITSLFLLLHYTISSYKILYSLLFLMNH